MIPTGSSSLLDAPGCRLRRRLDGPSPRPERRSLHAEVAIRLAQELGEPWDLEIRGRRQVEPVGDPALAVPLDPEPRVGNLTRQGAAGDQLASPDAKAQNAGSSQ